MPILLCAIFAAAPGPDSLDEAFRQSIHARGRPCEWGTAELDGHPGLERFAKLVDSYGGIGRVVVEVEGVQWELGPYGDSWRMAGECSQDEPLWRTAQVDPVVSVNELYGGSSQYVIAFRDGRPSLVRDSGSYEPFRSGDEHSSSDDWDGLVRSSTTTRRCEDSDCTKELDPPITGTESMALIPVESPGTRGVPATKTFVTHGETSWRGGADAALSVRAFSTDDDRVRLRIWTRDDVAIAPKDSRDASWIAADHVEIWVSRRQLGVLGGKARWLHPEGSAEPLPAIELGMGFVDVLLPPDLLAFAAGSDDTWQPYTAPLTVAFSDSDDPKKGQQTIVATSTIVWGDAASLGRIVRFPGNLRYPPWSDARVLGPPGEPGAGALPDPTPRGDAIDWAYTPSTTKLGWFRDERLDFRVRRDPCPAPDNHCPVIAGLVRHQRDGVTQQRIYEGVSKGAPRASFAGRTLTLRIPDHDQYVPEDGGVEETWVWREKENRFVRTASKRIEKKP